MSYELQGLEEPQKIIIELFDDICPKTCENFRQLCSGFAKTDKDTGAVVTEKQSYVNTEIHRVVKGMYAQGGDLSKAFRKYSVCNHQFFNCSLSHTNLFFPLMQPRQSTVTQSMTASSLTSHSR